MLVEVCCNSLESSLNAEKAGADRIELCSELGVGGVTPSYGLIQLVKERVSIPVHVLIRPRSAHFTYSDLEIEVMLRDIEFCVSAGIDGVVSGVLHQDFTVDTKKTALLVEASKLLNFTFHRAFDWVPDQKNALRQLLDLGIQTVLTSGGQGSAHAGLSHLVELKDLNLAVTIMPGGGVNEDNVLSFKAAGFGAVHLSGSQFHHQISLTGKIPMNAQKHLNEDKVAVSNVQNLSRVIQTVKEI